MQLRIRHCLSALVLLSTAACVDAPTSPVVDPGSAVPREMGFTDPGDPGECDPWQDVDWCEGGGDDPCVTSGGGGEGHGESVSVQGCTGSGPGGPGAGSTNPSDTCTTGDPAFDSPAIQQGLADIWNRSNPDAPQAQRLEQAAWIVRSTNGAYRMEPFQIYSQGPCGINGNLAAPANAVAWVHTHPFRQGEVQVSCGALKEPDPGGGLRDVLGPDGRPLYPTYDNRPSNRDRATMQTINETRASTLPQLSGVIIDYDKTTVYTENPSDGTTSLPRCGY